MEYIVSYDVATDTAGGERRLRRVAKVCEGYGQRVQKSVFECVLTDARLLQLVNDVSRVLDLDTDSFRVYRVAEPRAEHLLVLGRVLLYDQREPLIV